MKRNVISLLMMLVLLAGAELPRACFARDVDNLFMYSRVVTVSTSPADKGEQEKIRREFQRDFPGMTFGLKTIEGQPDAKGKRQYYTMVEVAVQDENELRTVMTWNRGKPGHLTSGQKNLLEMYRSKNQGDFQEMQKLAQKLGKPTRIRMVDTSYAPRIKSPGMAARIKRDFNPATQSQEFTISDRSYPGKAMYKQMLRHEYGRLLNQTGDFKAYAKSRKVFHDPQLVTDSATAWFEGWSDYVSGRTHKGQYFLYGNKRVKGKKLGEKYYDNERNVGQVLQKVEKLVGKAGIWSAFAGMKGLLHDTDDIYSFVAVLIQQNPDLKDEIMRVMQETSGGAMSADMIAGKIPGVQMTPPVVAVPVKPPRPPETPSDGNVPLVVRPGQKTHPSAGKPPEPDSEPRKNRPDGNPDGIVPGTNTIGDQKNKPQD